MRKINSKTVQIAVGLAAVLIFSVCATPGMAEEISQQQKREFLRKLCSGFEGEASCLSNGAFSLHQTVRWLIHQVCPRSGSDPVVVQCYARATHLATSLTGEKQFQIAKNHCEQLIGRDKAGGMVQCYHDVYRHGEIMTPIPPLHPQPAD